MGINALKVTENVKKSYIDYLSTTFEFENENIMRQFLIELKKEDFIVKGPILDITPSFKKGNSIKELVNNNILSKEFYKLNFPIDRTLYKHQEEAIRKVCSNKNIVVSTGTGSGKTESFLLPIINSLLKEKENKTLCPGVRALILYPMNALASDQLKRLRGILENYPDITFGSYTGEVEEKFSTALEKYISIHNYEPLKNELISREQIKKNPPNILITNYSMLEYLLLRPEDNTLFSGMYGEFWQYIVIDEAHMYTGAKGIEITMLLRRLQVEINKLNKGLRFILTSASLGRGREDYPKIAEFASKLCSSYFDPNDIIEGKRIETTYNEYLDYPIEIYEEVSNLIRKNSLVYDNLKDIFNKFNINISYDNISNEKELLFEIFSRDKRIHKIKNSLKNRFLSIQSIAKEIDENLNINILVDIIEIANKAQKNDETLIPGRYHMFVRSLEGAYLTLKPSLKLHLTPHATYNYNNNFYRAFEIGVCSNCKKIYIIGKEELDEEGYSVLKFSKNFSDNLEKVNYYLLENIQEEILEDEDSPEEDISLERYTLCASCGRIHYNNGKEFCNCGKENYVTVTKVSTKNNDGKLHKCISCGKVSTTNSIVRKIIAGNEASTSVLLDSLYKNIENFKISSQSIAEEDSSSELDFDFDFSFEDDNNSNEVEIGQTINDKIKNQILVFSDSRQNAAYFSSYFNFTYNKLLRRQILVSVLKEEKNDIETYTVNDLIKRLAIKFEKYYKKNLTLNEIQNEARKTILYEFMGIDGKNCLEDIGILTYKIILPHFRKNPLEIYGLSMEDISTLLNIFLYNLRKSGAVSDENKISEAEWYDYFINVPKNVSFSLTPKEFFKSWIPSDFVEKFPKKNNQRTEFLQKIGITDPKDIEKILKTFFENILVKKEINILTNDYSEYYKVNPQKFSLISAFSKSYKYYRCKKCKKITPFNLKNKCHVYRCDGELEEINIFDVMKDNHYWKSYMDDSIQPMVIAEHTAQLSKEEAKLKQEEFIKGNINILSCSTTFEVGVDVGELETVFMRNMPPTPANYVQRAGRAGRRVDSTAFALTYGSLKSHDFINFQDPSKMISGKISPPIFEIENYKIIKRHLYATVLSYFWKNKKDFYGKKFLDFLSDVEKLKLFRKYLEKKDINLLKKLKKIIPKGMIEEFKLDDWAWINEFSNDDETGILDIVTIEFFNDIQQYSEKIEELIKSKKFSTINFLDRNLNLMKSRGLIEVLSRGNIIPRYGFPVDTVSLQVEDQRVDLSRDLQQALIDYVPDSEIVANGKIFKSRYVKQMSNKALDRYEYRICENCNQITRVKKFLDKDINTCGNCGEKLKHKPIYSSEYQIPVFGFIAEKGEKEAGTKKPQRASKIEKFYVGNSLNNPPQILNFEIANNLFEIRYSKYSKMAVIGMGKGYGFLVCPSCGYSKVINSFNRKKIEETIKTPHKTSYGKECKTYLERTDLGYEFETDVVLINTPELDNILKTQESSILYSFLEGMSRALSIERTDIDGCFYGIDHKRFLVIYDKVPGGAGHSKRLLNKAELEASLRFAYKIVLNCTCGEDTACYSCLKNYNNQWYHEELSRKKAIEFYEKIF